MKGLSLGLVVLGIWRYGVATSALAAAQPLVAVEEEEGNGAEAASGRVLAVGASPGRHCHSTLVH
jgi:hypothetical protein